MATKIRHEPSWPKRDYPDLRDHIAALDKAGRLQVVKEKICKDTEMYPLVRWQFRGGVPEKERKAFLFTNVTDAKGKSYDMPVIVGAMAANRAIYAIGMGCAEDKIGAVWAKARANPIAPRLVEHAPCQEVVIQGAELLKPWRGLDALPLPISTPGYDSAPYITMPFFVTRDPDSGIQNMGAYRAQLKSPTRLGMNTSIENPRGGNIHWEKYRARGEKCPCAIVIGGPPAVWYVAGTRLGIDVDEVSVAGGLAGSAINVVKCVTVPLTVPAEADIVIEGYVDNEYLEPEAPFGESHGHVNLQEFNNVVEVTAITRRSDAILMSYINQLAPSESSVRARATFEPRFLMHLRQQVGIRGLTRVVAHEPLTGGSRALFLLFDRTVSDTEVWRALYAAASFQVSTGKIVIALSDDIDPESNLDAVIWSMVFRMKPHLDVKVLENWNPGHGPRDIVRGHMDSALLINAVLKHDMAPLALPKREFMEHAKTLWEDKLNLGALHPEAPWHGYSMGAWNDELDREAALAVKGDYWETGRRSAQRRRKGVAVNTEIRFVDEGEDGTE